MDIIFTLPGTTPEMREAFKTFAMLTNAGEIWDQGRKMQLTGGLYEDQYRPDFDIHVHLDENTQSAQLAFRTLTRTHVCDGFLNDRFDSDLSLTFNEAVNRLQGKMLHLDHVGVCVPRTLDPKIWMGRVDTLNQAKNLYEYPTGADDYDPQKNLWYFLLNKTAEWRTCPRSMTKFELVHDGHVASLVQIDIKTNLSPQQAEALFPEGFQIPELANYFRSVIVSTPWPDMRRIRLDIRFGHGPDVFTPDSVAKTEWENGTFFFKTQKPLTQDTIRLPAFMSQRV